MIIKIADSSSRRSFPNGRDSLTIQPASSSTALKVDENNYSKKSNIMNIITVSNSKGFYEETKSSFHIYGLNQLEYCSFKYCECGEKDEEEIEEFKNLSKASKIQSFLLDLGVATFGHIPSVLFETGKDFIMNVIHLEFGKKMFGDLKDGLLSLVYGCCFYVLLCLSPIIRPIKSTIDFVEQFSMESIITNKKVDKQQIE